MTNDRMTINTTIRSDGNTGLTDAVALRKVTAKAEHGISVSNPIFRPSLACLGRLGAWGGAGGSQGRIG